MLPDPDLLHHAPVVIDLAGTDLTAAEVARLSHPMVGGVILFARNWSDRKQLVALCRDIKRVRQDLLIMVDHEGGRVQRFKTDGFTHLPPMRVLGQLWLDLATQDQRFGAMRSIGVAAACGYVLGAELRACGVDLTFAPVLDLDHGSSGVIGDRAFASDPVIVTHLAMSLMHGLRQSGMANCGKHFPGHGFATADSHVDIALDGRSLESILQHDAAPYAWLAPVLASIMPAHVVYPQIDSRPAGFSRMWLGDILRTQMGFCGAVFSDDLSMEGARVIDGERVDFTRAALMALGAGCDMVLLCNHSLDGAAGIEELLDGLVRAQSDGLWRANGASEQRRLDLLPTSATVDWDTLMANPRYRRALALIP